MPVYPTALAPGTINNYPINFTSAPLTRRASTPEPEIGLHLAGTMPAAHIAKRKRARRRGRPKGGDSDLTRRRIVESACACFGQRGYATTTNQDIAETAGVTPAAIYQYFDSKKALYLEAVRSAHRLILPYFRDAVAAQESARGAFRDLARAYAVAHDRHPSVTPLLSALPVEMRRHAEIAEALASGPHEFSELVEALTARGVASGELAADLAEGTGAMLLACTMGLSLHASLMGKARFESAVEAFALLLDGSLLAKPTAIRPATKRARAR